MQHHGLIIATDYIGTSNRLSGCIKDSNNWLDAVKPHCCELPVLLQGVDAEKRHVVAEMTSLAELCRLGSEHFFFITFSGHGTQITGNEIDGKDEAICCDDFLNGGILPDNEIARLLAGSQGTFVTDCCHSGTLTRSLAVPRFIPFSQICEDLSPGEVQRICQGAGCAVRGRAKSGIIHLAGCLDSEYSYDTPNGGALSIAALATLPQVRTHGEWIDAIQKELPTPLYQQHPQMTATAKDLMRVVIGRAA
jgi:hypothetical protein